jgi:hypothetical protein
MFMGYIENLQAGEPGQEVSKGASRFLSHFVKEPGVALRYDQPGCRPEWRGPGIEQGHCRRVPSISTVEKGNEYSAVQVDATTHGSLRP